MELNTGDTAKAHKGYFEVVKSDANGISICYANNGNDMDGRSTTHLKSDKGIGGFDWFLRMVDRCMREEYKALTTTNKYGECKKLVYSEENKQKMFSTYGFLARNAVITSQIPPNHIKEFNAKYYDKCGKYPDESKSGYTLCSNETWAPTIRIRWPLGIPKTMGTTEFLYGYDVTVLEYKEKNEINSSELGWHLHEIGFDILGNAHDIDKILGNIPEKYHGNFRKGMEIL